VLEVPGPRLSWSPGRVVSGSTCHQGPAAGCRMTRVPDGVSPGTCWATGSLRPTGRQPRRPAPGPRWPPTSPPCHHPPWPVRPSIPVVERVQRLLAAAAIPPRPASASGVFHQMLPFCVMSACGPLPSVGQVTVPAEPGRGDRDAGDRLDRPAGRRAGGRPPPPGAAPAPRPPCPVATTWRRPRHLAWAAPAGGLATRFLDRAIGSSTVGVAVKGTGRGRRPDRHPFDIDRRRASRAIRPRPLWPAGTGIVAGTHRPVIELSTGR
jgi:hypothetical protein